MFDLIRMPYPRATLLSALLVVLALPATALARPTLEPLRDQVPLGSHFKDRVFTSSSHSATAAQSGKWVAYPIKDGTTVQVAVSPTYGNQLNTRVVQTYVDFLDSLDHGPELSQLKIFIAPPAEVMSECGGVRGVLACYDSRTKIMTVPGEEPTTGPSGVTLSYVIAHEYGHHIAVSRSNEPFSSFRFGPKYWASYELVCDRTIKGQLAPGNESDLYFSNPGEGWAETYAQLKYPGVEWRYNPLMKPDAGAFAAARRDVLNPWESGVTKVFKGSFGKRGSNTRRFAFDLHLDGRLAARLSGPRKANYNMVFTSNGKSEGRTSSPGSRDSVSYGAACREEQLEHVVVTVKRASGRGPFTLRVRYAG